MQQKEVKKQKSSELKPIDRRVQILTTSFCDYIKYPVFNSQSYQRINQATYQGEE